MAAQRENDTNGTSEPEQFRKLFVGGLHLKTDDRSLRKYFERWGEITDCTVMKDNQTQRSRGFGFVTYKTAAMLDAAQQARPHMIDGKDVESKRAMPKEESRGEATVKCKKIYISAVHETHTNELLHEYFGQFGEVENVEIVTDKTTGKRRGFAFIMFKDFDTVDKIILTKSHVIAGQPCNVRKAMSKEEMQHAKEDGGHEGRGGNRGGYRGGRGGGGDSRGGHGQYDRGQNDRNHDRGRFPDPDPGRRPGPPYGGPDMGRYPPREESRGGYAPPPPGPDGRYGGRDGWGEREAVRGAPGWGERDVAGDYRDPRYSGAPVPREPYPPGPSRDAYLPRDPLPPRPRDSYAPGGREPYPRDAYPAPRDAYPAPARDVYPTRDAYPPREAYPAAPVQRDAYPPRDAYPGTPRDAYPPIPRDAAYPPTPRDAAYPPVPRDSYPAPGRDAYPPVARDAYPGDAYPPRRDGYGASREPAVGGAPRDAYDERRAVSSRSYDDRVGGRESGVQPTAASLGSGYGSAAGGGPVRAAQYATRAPGPYPDTRSYSPGPSRGYAAAPRTAGGPSEYDQRAAAAYGSAGTGRGGAGYEGTHSYGSEVARPRSRDGYSASSVVTGSYGSGSAGRGYPGSEPVGYATAATGSYRR